MRFATASWPATPKTKESRQVALFYAFFLLVITVAQLVRFDTFVPVIQQYPVSESQAMILATTLVVCGVFALPFLLRMKLSPAFRFVSMLCGWVVPLIWLYLSVVANSTGSPVANVGILGSFVDIAGGWWAVSVFVAFGILAAWASWGLWPLRQQSM